MSSSSPAATDAVSRRLADTLAAARFEDLPSGTIAETRRAVLDWLGSALAGSVERPARLAQQVVARLGTSSDATVFSGGRSSAAGAALANGVASHILELDDVHKGSTLHAAAPVIPAALAVAERERADGRSFLLAVAVGYDAALRVGEAVNPAHYRFWHPTGTAATFGAAAAAGSLMGFDSDRMLHALGSAGTQAAGLWEFNTDGAMSKHLHPGKAAMNGVLSADLAAVGFTGASRILEGDRGFFRATASSYDPTRITDGLGKRWKIDENCYKMHSSCGHTHSAVDVALDLRARIGDGDIRAIDITTYGPGFAIVKESNPTTPYRGQFSIAYCVAAGLAEGQVGLAQFSGDRFDSTGVVTPAIAPLLKRTKVTVADDLTAKYPAAWPARVSVTLADGTTHSGAADFPRGNPENPVSTAELERKFIALVASRLGAPLAHRALHLVNSIESAADMASHFRDLLP